MNLSFSSATALMDELEDEGVIGPLRRRRAERSASVG